MSLPRSIIIIGAVLTLATLFLETSRSALAETDRGAYLARIMDCGGCHMPRGADGAPIETAGLSGGTVGFEMPGLGVFWAPNLTPHESGLSGWSKEAIIAAIRTGKRPDGRMLAPVMPWPAYAGLNDADADALATYLMALPAVAAPRLDPVSSSEAAPAPFYRVTFPAP